MEYLFIYCLQLFDFCHNLMFILFFIILISFLLFIVCKSASFADFEDNETKFLKSFKVLSKQICIVSLCLWIFFAFIPTKDTLLLLGGTYYGKKALKQVVTSEKLQKIDTIINLELDRKIKELQR